MKKLTAEEKLQMAFADNLIAQTELLEAITALSEVMAKIFNGEDRCVDNEIEQELLEDDLKNEAVEQTEPDIEPDEGIERIERHEAGEPDEKDPVELEASGILPDDDEDMSKDN
jgi:hypothetical protein